jgi:putative addiction module component (TIGR02574 family)
MTSAPKEVVAAAMALPPEARAQLAEQLLDSLDPQRARVDAEWAQEIDHRIREVEEGRAPTEPHQDVMTSVRRRLSNVRGA